MLSPNTIDRVAVTIVDGRFDSTREARADARFAARTDARATYVCWHRGALDPMRLPDVEQDLALVQR